MRKAERQKSKRALDAAMTDLLENGKQGRTIPEVSAQYGCVLGSLISRLQRDGITTADLEAIESRNAPPDPNSKPAQLANNQAPNLFPTKLVKNSGERGAVLTRSKEHTLSAETRELGQVNRVQAARLKESLLDYYPEIRSTADFERIYKLYKETLGLGKDSDDAGKGALIQVNILSQTGDRAGKPERIMDSGSETVTVPSETEDA